MKTTHLRKTEGAILLCLALLTGCSTSTPPQATPTSADITEEESVTVEDPAVVLTGKLPFTDPDGYQLEVSFEVVFTSEVTTDISMEKPGFATILAPGSSYLALTNNTSGRNYEFTNNNIKLYLGLGYPSNSPICQDRVLIGDECYIPVRTTLDFFGGSGVENFTVGPGETLELTTYSVFWNQESERVGTGIVVTQVPESNVDVYLATFAQPSRVYVAGEGTRLSSLECKVGRSSLDLFLVGSEPALPACP